MEPEYKDPEEKQLIKSTIKIVGGNEWSFNGKFGYNKTYFNEIDSLYKKLPSVKNEKLYKFYRTVIDKQEGFNFFPTPEGTIDKIMNFLKKEMENRPLFYSNIHSLEPSSGTARILRAMIDTLGNMCDTMTANEYLKEFATLTNENTKNVKVINSDFLDMKINSDLIIMNPPFSSKMTGTIGDKWYLDHISKGIDLLNRNGQLIVICPMLFKDDARAKDGEYLRNTLEEAIGFSFNVAKRINKKIKDFIFFEDKTPRIERTHQITKIGTANDFIKFGKNGKPLKMNQTFYIYSIVIS